MATIKTYCGKSWRKGEIASFSSPGGSKFAHQVRKSESIPVDGAAAIPDKMC